MPFATVVTCMDGRIQLPVITYLQERFGVEYIDTITESGPVGLLAADPESEISRAIYRRIDISLEAHQSDGIAVVAHYDCAGNPVDEARQREQLGTCLDVLRNRYPAVKLVGLWVDETWSVCEV